MQGWIVPADSPALPIDDFGDGARAAFKVLAPLIALSELVTVQRGVWDGAIQHKDGLPVAYVMADEAGALDSPLYGMFSIVGKLHDTKVAGQSLAQIRAVLMRDLRYARSEMERLLASSLDIAEQAFAPAREEAAFDGMLVAGQTRLMGLQDLNDLDRLRALFEAFAEKRELLQLLERTAKAPGMRVFIGEETGIAPLEGMSLVTAPYGRDGRVLGVLGVIGPSRMAYERVIPVVEATAAILGAALDAPP